MALKATFQKKTFQFSFKARTSRGLMKDKTSWFILLRDTRDANTVGIGECGPLPGLSPDAIPSFEAELTSILNLVSERESLDDRVIRELVSDAFPSIRFGLETAWLDLRSGGRREIFKSKFMQGDRIPINGLIWMGDLDFMMSQINQKIAQGFTCIKLKVGGLDFDRECDILGYIRKRYFRHHTEIRLDANGAFKLEEALFKLNELKKFDIQSIEQPIKAAQPEMEELCRKSPIPVALDEELIGITSVDEKKALLASLKPRYVILKPTLLGGFASCDDWIKIAEGMNIGWWITSALESNIGLNAICQYTGMFDIRIPQGLGTGGIYENNIASPLRVSEGYIEMSPSAEWGSLDS